jgi:hypothetical protein
VRISAGHPLRALFGELLASEMSGDREVAQYVANLLLDFVRTDQLYRIRDARGKHLEEIGEMLVESNPLLIAASFDREREVRKHIGDFTLFFTGMFRDSFIDYIEAGKESYRIVAAFNATTPLRSRLRKGPLIRRNLPSRARQQAIS